jgi:Tfp pilus assembly protein PilX
MKRTMRQSGFAYIAAVVLLIVVAGVCVALLRLSSTQQNTVNGSLLGARASLAARAGLEWGFYQLSKGNCLPTKDLTDFVADTGFRVTVQCISTPFNEGENSSGAAVVKNSVRLQAFACNSGATCPATDAAVVARPDYVERRRVATTCTMGAAGLC